MGEGSGEGFLSKSEAGANGLGRVPGSWCKARRTDGSNLVRRTPSKGLLRLRVIAESPVIEPTVEKWFRAAVQQTLKRR
jgi:hypothetical protein